MLERGSIGSISGYWVGNHGLFDKKRERKELWLFLFYFTLMAALHAFTYLYIDQCSSMMNKTLTFIGYTHIAFQPFFINMAAMCFIPEEIKNKISKYVYGLFSMLLGNGR